VAQPWEPWFQAAGHGLTEPRQGPLFTDAGALIDAAVAGQGVALARASLVEAELESGRLVRLWRRSIGDIYAHYVVWRPDSPKRTAIEVLLEWLRAQTAKRAG
jgi:DNA-binding transcriptional LysR family regulator